MFFFNLFLALFVIVGAVVGGIAYCVAKRT